MSEHGFPVSGLHDRQPERAPHDPSCSFAGRLAIVTAAPATIGALFFGLGGTIAPHALFLGSGAAIRKPAAVRASALRRVRSNAQQRFGSAIESAPEARWPAYSNVGRVVIERALGGLAQPQI